MVTDHVNITYDETCAASVILLQEVMSDVGEKQFMKQVNERITDLEMHLEGLHLVCYHACQAGVAGVCLWKLDCSCWAAIYAAPPRLRQYRPLHL